MALLYTSKPKGLLGIDIADNSVNLVELSKHSHLIRLECYASAKLPAGAVIDGLIHNEIVLAETLQQLILTAKPSCRDAVIALPDNAVIEKQFELPARLNKKQRQAQIEALIAETIPYPIHDVAFDYWLALTQPETEANQTFSVAVCRKQQVQSREIVLAMAELNCIAIELQSCAQWRSRERLTSLSCVNLALGVERTELLSMTGALEVAYGLAARGLVDGSN